MTRLRELLAIAKERSQMLRVNEFERMEKYDSVADRLVLNKKNRSNNLRILRAFMDEYQDEFKRLVMIGSQSTYSKVESGDIDFPEKTARMVESELDFPIGWFDRDNTAGLFASNEELSLLQELRKSPSDVTTALLDVIHKLRSIKNYP